MDNELQKLRIDRTKKTPARSSSLSPLARGLMTVMVLACMGSAGFYIYNQIDQPREVQTVRVVTHATGSAVAGGDVILNATGYIIAAHKIELASKVVGKVSWVGVNKGDKVKEGQPLVRLEDDEYRARVDEARGQLNSVKARLAALEHGSRPEEIDKAGAELEQVRADLKNAQVALERTASLVKDKIMSKQALDDAQARYNAHAAKFASYEKSHRLLQLGPRREDIDAVRAQVKQLEGVLALANTQLSNAIIRAPVSGIILERNVEKGEFVTTGFVGDRGAKGYVVSIADLNDLQVELDINQSDFAKLEPNQAGIVTTDAYPDKRYQGFIEEISPEANRQKATVQIKVKIKDPDNFLRPEMNASVNFLAPDRTGVKSDYKPLVTVPASAVRDNAVFIVADGRAVRRAVKVDGGAQLSQTERRISQGLTGGEDVIVNPPADMQDGQKVKPK
jgi:HlyD family secretion protein